MLSLLLSALVYLLSMTTTERPEDINRIWNFWIFGIISLVLPELFWRRKNRTFSYTNSQFEFIREGS